jgi:predicted O-linked N-acetylglucosamine transferase (SPINDLY family)
MGSDAIIPYLLQEAAACVAGQRFNQAYTLLSKAFYLAPEHQASFLPLATLCQLTKRRSELEQLCRMRLAAVPNDTDALYHLSGVLLSRQHFSDGIACLRRILALNPRHLNAWIDLGCAVKKLGDIEQALDCFRQALTIDPASAIASDNYLFALLFTPRQSPAEIFAAHRRWGMALPIAPKAGLQPLPAGEKIKIGYISPDFREHSVASFFEPLLAAHDRHAFQITCYHSHDVEDQVTARLRQSADQWRTIADMDDETAAAVIRRDGIHILVEMAGHTAWNRLELLNLRPAPLQVTWLGYPHSTGLASVDYRISDGCADPLGSSELLHTEQLWRIAAPFLCFMQPENAPPVAPLPAERNGFVTFCSFNNFAKVNDEVIALWREILDELPEARLLLKSEVFADEVTAANIIQLSGLPRERLILIGTTPDRGAHLALYGQVDIALDTFPYNGTTTTCEALYMGVPVVTLRGEHHAARVGGTLLEAVGTPELMAENRANYVAAAVSLAQDLPKLRQLRAGLRGMLEGSALMDRHGFAVKIEAAYREMLQRAAVC